MPKKAFSNCRDVVLNELAKGPKSWAELLKATGASEATLYRVLKALEKEGVVFKDQERKWALVASACKDALRSKYLTPFCSFVGCEPNEALEKILEVAQCDDVLKGIQRFEENTTKLIIEISKAEPGLSIFVNLLTQNSGLSFAVALEASLIFESINALIEALKITRSFDYKGEIAKLLKEALESPPASTAVKGAWDVIKALEPLGYNGVLKLTVLGVKVDLPLREIILYTVYNTFKLGHPIAEVIKFLGKAVEIGYRILESGYRPLTEKEINELISVYKELKRKVS